MSRITVAALSLSLLVAFALPGCGSSDEKTVQLVEETAQLFEDNKGDCDKLGTEFESFTSKNELRFVDLRRIGRLSGEERKAFDAKYGRRLEAAMRKLMDGATACMSNPKVADALKKIR
jgi:hypothetical protein